MSNQYEEKDGDSRYAYNPYEGRDRFRRFPQLNDQDEEGYPLRQEPDESGGRTLKRKGDAKPPRFANVPAGMSRCELCEALVPRSRMQEHIDTRHTQQDDVPMEACPHCSALVRADRLDKHLRKVHPGER